MHDIFLDRSMEIRNKRYEKHVELMHSRYNIIVSIDNYLTKIIW